MFPRILVIRAALRSPRLGSLARGVAVASCLLAMKARAQDPSAIAPESYRTQFENDWVRVMRVHYAPHSSIAAHLHAATAAAFVYLNDAGPVTFRHVGAAEADTLRPATIARAFRLNREVAEIHEVVNENDTASDFLRLEFKTEPLDDDSLKGRFPPLPHTKDESVERVQFDNAQMRVTRVVCASGTSCDLPGAPNPRIVVAFVRSQLGEQSRQLESGMTAWLKPDERQRIRSIGEEAAECLIFEFKTKPLAPSATELEAGTAQPATASITPAWSQEVTVTAGRGAERLGDTASRVVVLGADELRTAAASALDDALRQVPGFTLFRRAGSRAANPTAQGASLRGIGPSGASRTLVLLDGLPLNDGFGGWVYWSRVSHAALDKVEVMEGGASDLYGSGALAGVVQAFVREEPGLAIELGAGSSKEQQASLYAAGRKGFWGARISGEAFRTDGYYLVDQGRGTADARAASRHLNAALRLDRRTNLATAFVEASRFGESRENGTVLQTNDTDWGQVNAGADLIGKVRARAFYGTQTYHQTFTAVAADHDSEALTRTQRVPSRDASGSLQWTVTSRRNALSLGADGRFIRGRSEETAITAGRATTFTDSGGHQANLAAFATDRVTLGTRGSATIGARVDRWSLGSASSLSTPVATGQTSTTSFADRTATAFSPRASLLLRLSREFRITASGYGAFRAPTLNELYRSFRVGDTQTLANADLTSERLIGGETGIDWERGPVHMRVVAYRADVRDPVANVTLRTTPALITRQRLNLGRTRSQGLSFELAGSWHVFRGGAGYALTDAKVIDFSVAPEIEGKTLAQVPRHQWTMQGRASARGFDVSAQARYGGRQFEDDQNTLSLKRSFVLDARLARRVRGGLEVFLSMENLSDSRYPVGLTPLETLGQPRIVRIGLRLDRAHTTRAHPPGD